MRTRELYCFNGHLAFTNMYTHMYVDTITLWVTAIQPLPN
jgi:hypothetical protein